MTDIETLEMARAEVEWEYPMEIYIALDHAISDMKKLQIVKQVIEDYRDCKIEDANETIAQICEVLEDGND